MSQMGAAWCVSHRGMLHPGRDSRRGAQRSRGAPKNCHHPVAPEGPINCVLFRLGVLAMHPLSPHIPSSRGGFSSCKWLRNKVWKLKNGKRDNSFVPPRIYFKLGMAEVIRGHGDSGRPRGLVQAAGAQCVC